jgi:hypothetical protein
VTFFVDRRLKLITLRLRRLRGDMGVVTTEYAVLIGVAVAFAGVLLAIVKSSAIAAYLTTLVETHLQ